MAPRLSIVSITRDDPEGLRRTIASLQPLVETRSFEWEHVVVDSSPESTRPALDGLASGGWPLRHIKMSPEGVYAAQNAGAAASRGDVLWFLNGGDELFELASLTHCMGAFEAAARPDLVIAAVELHSGKTELSVQRPHRLLIYDLVGSNRVCHQGVLYRRAFFSQIGPFSLTYRIAADYEHLLRCLAGSARIETLPHLVLAAYDVSGVSSVRYREAFRELRQIQRSLVGRVPIVFLAACELLRPFALMRVSTSKTLWALPFGQRLRAAWHRLKSQ